MIDGTIEVNGLTLGTDPYQLVAAPVGVMSTAPIRESDEPRPRADGVVAGDDFADGRPLVFEVGVFGTTPADCEAKASDLAAAFAPTRDEVTLMVRIAGAPSEYAFFGRPRGADIILDHLHPALDGPTTAIARCSFMATDPTRYGAEMIEVVGLVSHPLPQTMPFVLGYYDSTTFENAGAASVDRWIVEIEAVGGPLTDPSIAHAGKGRLIFHDLTLQAGETLAINGQERRALINGVTPVIPTIAQWWRIEPGSNEVRFASSSSSSITSTATLTWRPGWN